MSRPRRTTTKPQPPHKERLVYRTEPVSMPFSRTGRDDGDVIEAIRELAHPMLVVEIEGRTMASICRRVAEVNDNLRGRGETNFQIPYPDDAERCACCGQPIEGGDE